MKRMNNAELRSILEEIDHLRSIIETKVKRVYKKHGELTIKAAEEICRRNGGQHSDGILRVPLRVKFKDGKVWELYPNYMKDGQLANVIWKPAGVHAFSIKPLNHLPDEEQQHE